MPEESPFAYSLNQLEKGWKWCVYDAEGITVADGADATRRDAESAIEHAIRLGLAGVPLLASLNVLLK